MLDISTVIITLNAETYLRRVLESVSFTREIVVVDCGSTDNTLKICRQFGARIFQRNWTGYGAQKNFGIEQAQGPWILSLDADEVLSEELTREIRALPEHPPYSGYRIPRVNHYFGRALHHGGQYPDLQLRLFLKEKGRFNQRPVHESVVVSGSIGRLSGEILHYSYDSIEEYFNKFSRYTSLEAERLHSEGVKLSPAAAAWYMLFKPWFKFIWRYFFKLGFLDGVAGLLAAVFNSFTMVASYAKYWEKYRKDSAYPQRSDR